MDIQIEELANVVEETLLQLTYPGLDACSIKLSLPEKQNRLPAKVFGQALKHKNILVRLAALRWFQEKPGMAANYTHLILDGLNNTDTWLRLESLQCLAKIKSLDDDDLNKLLHLANDPSVEVRKILAKTLGKTGNSSKVVIETLEKMANDIDKQVCWKAQKALKKLKAYVV